MKNPSPWLFVKWFNWHHDDNDTAAKTVIDVDDTVVHWVEKEFIGEAEARTIVIISTRTTVTVIGTTGVIDETEIGTAIVAELHPNQAMKVTSKKIKKITLKFSYSISNPINYIKKK